jgi:hypothetical protein
VSRSGITLALPVAGSLGQPAEVYYTEEGSATA